MLIPRFVVWMFLVGMLFLGAGVVSGQPYPNKPVRFVTAEPGAANDFAARIIAHGLTSSFGQQVIVENRGGASGAIAAEFVAKALPDGYTLLFYNSNIWLLPFLRKNMPYDPVKDFAAITLATRSPTILVVHPRLPVNSVKELIALAKARPGELNYGSGAAGSSSHLAPELFKTMAGVNIVNIPYKGGGPALNDLISGQLQVMFLVAGTVAPHIKSGRLKALAIASAHPSALLPGLPTVAASGLPGYELATIFGVFAPAKTPAALVNRLNQEIVRVLNTKDVKDKFFDTAVETVGSSPEEFAAKIKSEMARLGKVIKDAGIRAE